MCTRVLSLLALQLALAYCITWDIVVGGKNQLEFYKNRTLTHTEDIPSSEYVRSLIYDPVHYRVLFAYEYNSYISISNFDLSNLKTQTLLTRISNDQRGDFNLAYDPVTQLLFYSQKFNLYSFSLKPASTYKAVDVNLVLTLNHYCREIAVESCGRYIFWTTDREIERARLDGSEREVLIVGNVFLRTGLAIDQLAQKIYWAEDNYSQKSIVSADLNGKNRKTLHSITNAEFTVGVLTLSKDFIYWKNFYGSTVWQFTKDAPHDVKPILSSTSNEDCGQCQSMAANYTIEEQTQGTKSCETLKSLASNSSSVPNTTDITLLCVYGKKVSGESHCECTQGYTGERCEVNICRNYCFQGNCIVSAEGQPKCRCNAGYTGERCEIFACHKHCFNNGVCSLNEADEPTCQCTADYEGERCEVSVCKDYCLNGNCSVSTYGQLTCSCKAGYSGDRCEVNACYKHCLNGGVCSLNEEDEPVCECQKDFEGERCDDSVSKDFSCHADCSVNAEGQPKVTLTLGKGVKSTCASTVV